MTVEHLLQLQVAAERKDDDVNVNVNFNFLMLSVGYCCCYGNYNAKTAEVFILLYFQGCNANVILHDHQPKIVGDIVFIGGKIRLSEVYKYAWYILYCDYFFV